MSHSIRMEYSDGRTPPDTVDAINDAIGDVGGYVEQLAVDGPSEIELLLAQTTLSPDELEQLRDHFLMSRERLLEVIALAGREPQVEGGGAMSTHVVSHDYDYPQLYVAAADIDYTRFDRFHVNTSDAGASVDEVIQILSGTGITTHLRKPDGVVMTLHFDCSADRGWLLTYDGAAPHITSMSTATPGTKALVQVIGTPEWSINYLDDEPYVG